VDTNELGSLRALVSEFMRYATECSLNLQNAIAMSLAVGGIVSLSVWRFGEVGWDQTSPERIIGH
jgi:hypothetical protein